MASPKTKSALRRSSSVKNPSSFHSATSSNPLKPSASWSSLHTKSNGTGTSLLCGSPRPPAAWSSVSPRQPATGFSSKLPGGSSAVSPNSKFCTVQTTPETTQRVPNGDVIISKRTPGKGVSSSSSKSSVTFGGSAGFVVTNKHPTSQQSTREIIQRLTNGGIPSVSTTRRQRRYSLDLSATAAAPSSPRTSSETSEPKSILKNASSRRCSISYGEIARGPATSSSLPAFHSSKPSFSHSSIFSSECSVTSTSAAPKYSSDMDTVPESDLDILPGDEAILRNCQYRLGPAPVTSPCDAGGLKKVTFDDDVIVMQKGRRNRRHSVPSMK